MNTYIEANQEYLKSRLADLRELKEEANTGSAALNGTDFASWEAIDTQTGQLEADLNEAELVPMTGLPTDQVYSTFFDVVLPRTGRDHHTIA